MQASSLRHGLPWCDPAQLVGSLVATFGAEGLVWLDGDGSAQGRWSRIGLGPQHQTICRGLPGMAGASDPFAALAAMGEQGGHWMGWLAYEAGAWVEPGEHWGSSDLAMLWAARFEAVLVFDHHHHSLTLEGSQPSSTTAALADTLGWPAGGDRSVQRYGRIALITLGVEADPDDLPFLRRALAATADADARFVIVHRPPAGVLRRQDRVRPPLRLHPRQQGRATQNAPRRPRRADDG